MTPPIHVTETNAGDDPVKEEVEANTSDQFSSISSDESLLSIEPEPDRVLVPIAAAVDALTIVDARRVMRPLRIRTSILHLVKNLKLILAAFDKLPPRHYQSVKGQVGGTQGFLLGISRQVVDVLPLTKWDSISAEMPKPFDDHLTLYTWAVRVVQFTEEVCGILTPRKPATNPFA